LSARGLIPVGSVVRVIAGGRKGETASVVRYGYRIESENRMPDAPLEVLLSNGSGEFWLSVSSIRVHVYPAYFD
jgi:hypothetical protein